MARIDLNADVGEGMALDVALLAVVTSANVACGGHAGDAATMRATLLGAQHHGVTIGAHPGWADPGQFGRARLTLPLHALRETLQTQLAALQAVARETGTAVRYVKLHGALANQAAEDDALADAVAGVLHEAQLGWLVMPRTAMQRAAQGAQVLFHTEAFADRTYDAHGLLTPRDKPGAVLHAPHVIADRACAMLERQALLLADGRWLATPIDSLCVHGDTPGALAIAEILRARLLERGWQVRALDW